MIDPDLPFARPLLAVVLAALIGLLVWRAVRKDRREYSQFKRYRNSRRRRRMYRKWLLDSFAFLGGAAVVIIALTWQFVPLLLAEIEAYSAVQVVRAFLAANGGLGNVIVVSAVILLLVASAVAIVIARNSEAIPAIGDIHALLPRNRAELRWGAALSVNAGVVEELLFRLALPALIYAVVGNATVAVLVALAVFGALHLYQGAAGVIGSTVIGAFLMIAFLGTGSILVAIVLHALIDLRSLVLIPAIVQRVHRRPANYSPPVRPAPPVPAEPGVPPL